MERENNGDFMMRIVDNGINETGYVVCAITTITRSGDTILDVALYELTVEQDAVRKLLLMEHDIHHVEPTVEKLLSFTNNLNGKIIVISNDIGLTSKLENYNQTVEKKIDIIHNVDEDASELTVFKIKEYIATGVVDILPHGNEDLEADMQAVKREILFLARNRNFGIEYLKRDPDMNWLLRNLTYLIQSIEEIYDNQRQPEDIIYERFSEIQLILMESMRSTPLADSDGLAECARCIADVTRLKQKILSSAEDDV